MSILDGHLGILVNDHLIADDASPEVDAGLVAGAEAVGGHVHDGGRLADGAAVHHGLVPANEI